MKTKLLGFSFVLGVLVLLSLSPFLTSAQSASTAIFKTGFENNTTLSSASSAGSSYYQNIFGTDLSTGFTWPITFPGVWVNSAATGIHAITDNQNLDRFTPQTDYIENRLDTVVGHTGAQTKVLAMDIKKPTSTWSAEQDVFQVQFDGTSTNIPSEMYERYWMKFNPELKSQIQAAGNTFWRSFFGFKTGSDYRMEAYIQSDSNGNAYWHLQGDNGPASAPTDYYLWLDNKTVPVPLDKWFPVEIYLNRGTPGGKDGRIFLSADGRTVFDQKGSQTWLTGEGVVKPSIFWGINNQPIYFVGLSFIYTSIQGPASQMIDDFELYNKPPCSSLPCVSAVPKISSFTAAPSTLVRSKPVVLSWNVSDATSLSIDQGVGSVTGTSVTVTPTQTTTYTLTATNWSGSATSTATVTINSTQLDDRKDNHKASIFDYNTLVGNFGKSGTNIAGDINGNGRVDIFDYNSLVSSF